MKKIYIYLLVILIYSSCKKGDNSAPDSIFPYKNGDLEISIQDANTPDNFIDLCFFDSLNGVALSQSGKIYKTSDGCHTWNLTYQHSVIERSFHNLEFVNNLMGFAVGGQSSAPAGSKIPGSVVVRTLDGGNTWTEVLTIDSADAPRISSNSLGHVFVIWLNRVYKSEDNGNTWVRNDLSQKIFMSAMTFNMNSGFIAGGSGILYKSRDNGITWTQINSPITSYIHTLAFNGNKGFAALSGMNLYKTSDNGETWTLNDTSSWYSIRNIRYLDNSIILGSGGIYSGGDFGTTYGYLRYSFDDGASWKNIKEKSEYYFGSTSFYTPVEGYMIGSRKVYKIKFKK